MGVGITVSLTWTKDSWAGGVVVVAEQTGVVLLLGDTSTDRTERYSHGAGDVIDWSMIYMMLKAWVYCGCRERDKE